MKHKIIILMISLIVLIKEGFCQSNPCPDVFQFKSDGHKKYGIVTIPPPGNGLTILEIQIGIRDPKQGESTKLKLVKSLDETLKDADKGKDIQYKFNFPQSKQLPYIEKITLNNREICNGPIIHNIYKFRHKFKIENPRGATHLSHIPYRQQTPRPVFQTPTVQPTVYQASPQTINPVGNPWLPGYQINPEGNPWLSNRHPISSPPSLPSSSSPSSTLPPNAAISPVRNQDQESSWVGTLPFAGICGRGNALQATQLIIGGVEVAEGEFPWMVALFHYEGRPVGFKCGASLISSTYVITAAHCTKQQVRVHLEFGRHNISNNREDGYTYRTSTQIVEHPEYVSGAHNDVALISFDRLEFSPRIHPICLWAQGTKLDNILVRLKGTVTGWGQIDNDATENTIPMKLNVSMVGLDTCRSSHVGLQKITSDKTFCAGGDSRGPCHGDSGSGFYIRHGKVWYIRGIVSTSLGTAYTCNVDEYAVYADLAYFLDWMRPYLLS